MVLETKRGLALVILSLASIPIRDKPVFSDNLDPEGVKLLPLVS